MCYHICNSFFISLNPTPPRQFLGGVLCLVIKQVYPNLNIFQWVNSTKSFDNLLQYNDAPVSTPINHMVDCQKQ